MTMSSKDLFKTAFEFAPVAITITDAKEKIISANRFAQKLYGVTDLVGKPVKSLYPPSEWRKMRKANIRKLGFRHHFETQIVQPKGDLIDIDISLSVIKDKEGKIVGSIGIARDIRERKAAEQEILKKEHQIEGAFEKSPLPTFIIDKDHKIIAWNKASEKLTGVKKTEVIGTTKTWKGFYQKKCSVLADFLIENDIKGLKKRYKDLQLKETTQKGTYQVTIPLSLKKKERIVFCTGAVVQDANKDNVLAVETILDITNKEKAQAKIDEQTAQLKKNHQFLFL
jgi:PAS domain S-box-containing protein